MKTRIPIVELSIAALVLLVAGSCVGTTVNCWRRGGTVLRNAFDWPTCVQVTRK